MCSVLQNFYQDIHDIAHTEGTSTKVVHDRAEVFDIKTEALFRYLQVCALVITPTAILRVLVSDAVQAAALLWPAAFLRCKPAGDGLAYAPSMLNAQVHVSPVFLPSRCFRRASCPSRTAPTTCPTPWAPSPLCTRSGTLARCQAM